MFQENSYKTKMSKTLEVFTKELSSLRTGRANASMLDLVKVDVYGQNMPINQLGTITTPEPRTINIQVWDTNNVNLVDAAIKKSELGLNPQIDGQLLRLPIPDLSEERRLEMKKIVKSMGEKCKVSIRNIRREGNDDLKKLLKSKEISEDDEKKFGKIIQDHTDNNIKLIDEKVLSKEKEIMTYEPTKHVAIIMDGNGRWGKKKKNRNYGHKKGIETVEKIISAAIQKNKIFNIIRFFY